MVKNVEYVENRSEESTKSVNDLKKTERLQ